MIRPNHKLVQERDDFRYNNNDHGSSMTTMTSTSTSTTALQNQHKQLPTKQQKLLKKKQQQNRIVSFLLILAVLCSFGFVSLSLHTIKNDFNNNLNKNINTYNNNDPFSVNSMIRIGTSSTTEEETTNERIDENQQQNHPPNFDNPISSSLYWDLSCPLELSMFSGVHMGGERRESEGEGTAGDNNNNNNNNNDYADRARKARQEVLTSNILSFFQNIDWNNLSNRRIYFIGDSIMRQTFISVGCLLWNDNDDENMVLDYTIPWFDKDRQVNMNHPNTIGAGHAHSKFEEGRVLLKHNIELIYHHGIGRLLELQGDDYQNHESPDEGWLKSCYTRQPLTALVPKLFSDQEHHHPHGQVNNKSKTTVMKTTTATTTSTVRRERLEISTNDVVILNSGVHSTRSSNFQNIGDLFRCKKRMTATTTTGAAATTKSSLSQSWPHFLYLVTGPSHFPTATGAYDRSLSRDLVAVATTTDTPDLKDTSSTVEKFHCKDVTNYTVPQTEDVAFCTEHNIPIVGLNSLPKQRLNGALHVGSGDCLHWLQPGIPDLVAAEIFRYLLSS